MKPPPLEPPLGPDAPRFALRLRTRWSDEDTQAVLNHAVYLTLFEDARHAYFAALGLLEENRFPFVLLQANARFLASARGGDEVLVELATVHVGERSFRQRARIRAAATGVVLCEAEAVLVGWDAERRASRPLAAAFRERVQAFEAGPAI